MESWLYVRRESTRQLILGSNSPEASESTFAISFESVNHDSEKEALSVCKMTLTTGGTLDHGGLERLLEGPVYGSPGLIKTQSDEFLCVITAISHVGAINGHNLYRIEKVGFYSLKDARYDNADIMRISREESLGRSSSSHPCQDLMSLLSEGTFYFGYDWDATKNLQKTMCTGSSFSWKSCEESFFWNRFMLEPVSSYLRTFSPEIQKRFQIAGLFVAMFQGFAQISEFDFGRAPASLALISRHSCKRAGTRYKSRGIDDDGNVSNFVETETIFSNPKNTFSSIIIRGTVPVFWDQQGFQLGYPKIQITRAPTATQPAFDRHIQNLNASYGLVHLVDLLSQKEGQAEEILSKAFDFHARKVPDQSLLSRTQFDIYTVCRSSYERLDSLFHLIGRDLQVFGYFVITTEGQVLKTQKGVFRVNCLDCLDRTNIVQNYIERRVLDLYLRNYLLGSGSTYDISILQNALARLWEANGDQLSRIYAGSDAIKSSYGRLGKLTLSSIFEDFKNSARRFYSNNFQEKQRQHSIDMLLGKSSQSRPIVTCHSNIEEVDADATKGKLEPLAAEAITFQVISWNTNATTPIEGEDYWPLLSLPKGFSPPQFLVVGMQEIVQLNPTQIISVDPERRLVWESTILRILQERYPKFSYSLLVAHQLVGTTLSIFVRADCLDSVRNVEIASKKTGMAGMAGNKGSVAVRMQVYGISICLISSHFTAGQSNAIDRDRDWNYAINDLQLSGGRSVLAHDAIIWLGDFNYRLDLDRDEAMDLIAQKRYDLLKEHDQLHSRIQRNQVFIDFNEVDIQFPPTYKYDPGTNIYDTRYNQHKSRLNPLKHSDKMRVPSWTDRILFKGNIIGSYYDRAELDDSDHKPVKALLQVEIAKTEKSEKSDTRIGPTMENGTESPQMQRVHPNQNLGGAYDESFDGSKHLEGVELIDWRTELLKLTDSHQQSLL